MLSPVRTAQQRAILATLDMYLRKDKIDWKEISPLTRWTPDSRESGGARFQDRNSSYFIKSKSI